MVQIYPLARSPLFSLLDSFGFFRGGGLKLSPAIEQLWQFPANYPPVGPVFSITSINLRAIGITAAAAIEKVILVSKSFFLRFIVWENKTGTFPFCTQSRTYCYRGSPLLLVGRKTYFPSVSANFLSISATASIFSAYCSLVGLSIFGFV